MWDDVSGTPAFNGFTTFWASLVIFQNIIPISLYVSIEFVKTMQAYFIWNDLEMYDEETGTHCIPRSWNLSDDLGQVQYVFSDKTGTLTRNIMEFRKCTINGKIYGDNGFSPESEGARGARLRREQEERAANHDLESGGEKKDPEEEKKEFLEKRDAIFDQYKEEVQSVFQPKYSSMDVNKLTFADPQIFKDLKGEQSYHSPDSALNDNFAIHDVNEKGEAHRASVTPSLPACSNAKESVYDFFTALCLCHTAVVEKIDKQGNPIEEMQADETEDAGKPEPDIIIPEGSDGKLANSGSKTTTLNDSVGTSAPSTTATASDGETPIGSTATKRSRLRNALHKHKRRLTNRSSKMANANRRGSRGKEFDALPGQKPKLVDTTVEQQLNYKSESPDESALVAAAKNVGFTFLKRKGSTLTVDILGQQYEYELLNIIEFNSTRKRMSVIVRRPDPWNDIVLYCKGADNIIIERLRPGQEHYIDQVSQDIEGFSNEGLRTLVLAYKIIPEQAYTEWSSNYHEASTSIKDRAERMDEVNESMEDDLILLGATAIEDKLQDQVPDCIETLREAGIKVWVLTGDKVETAINIGYASNLLSNDSKLWIVRGAQDSDEALQNFEDIISQMEQESDDIPGDHSPAAGEKPRHNSLKGPIEHALVIDGLALKHLLETEESKARLLQVVLICKSVVCCRVSPLQKALVVELVRRGEGAVTLAIGDGANDVSMIQAANIGVGIAGQEGAQASMSADYAIGQFKFLKKLLLVQGHWSYDRISEMILNFFYKNVVWVFGGLWYQIFCGFSANIFYDYSFLQLYNLIFTLAPTCVIGCTDQDVTKDYLFRYSQIYEIGIHKKLYTKKRFWLYFLEGVYQSCIIFFGFQLLYIHGALPLANGLASSYLELSCAVAITIITVANLEPGFNTRYWTWWQFFCIGLEIVLVFLWVVAYSSFATSMQGIGFIVLANPNFWLVYLMTIIVAMMPRYIITYYLSWIRPDGLAMVRQLEKYEKHHKQ
ncbi:hypothetical protein INT43_008230 [Umbelopsis isabellina]|uniref:Phospholipid-transporting ATPase n=1 Tax=Mortierella isabellina TaxID=91625 RepID=A0A8H7U9I9_MORIS|nr:hypothetical protein INT43_008230 [Umbelopsis isabellina]